MSDTGDSKRRTTSDDGVVRQALWAVLMGLVGLLSAFVVVAIRWNDESGVAALAAVASSIAAILTGYFGMQFGSGRRRRG